MGHRAPPGLSRPAARSTWTSRRFVARKPQILRKVATNPPSPGSARSAAQAPLPCGPIGHSPPIRDAPIPDARVRGAFQSSSLRNAARIRRSRQAGGAAVPSGAADGASGVPGASGRAPPTAASGCASPTPEPSRRPKAPGRSTGPPASVAPSAGEGPAQARMSASSPLRNRWHRTPPVARPLDGNSAYGLTFTLPAAVPGKAPALPATVTTTWPADPPAPPDPPARQPQSPPHQHRQTHPNPPGRPPRTR